VRASIASAAAIAAAIAPGFAGATGAKLLPFSVLSHASSQPTVATEHSFGKAFVNVITRVTEAES
jgi:ATP-dependent Zn protease